MYIDALIITTLSYLVIAAGSLIASFYVPFSWQVRWFLRGLANFVFSCCIEHLLTIFNGGHHGGSTHSALAVYEALSSGVFASVFTFAIYRLIPHLKSFKG